MNILTLCNRLLNSLLLIFIIIAFNSCNRNSERVIKLYKEKKKDSILISVNFKTKGLLGFNIEDKYFHSYYLEFRNRKFKDTIILKKIFRTHKIQTINTGGFNIINEKYSFYQHYFLIDSTDSKLNFKYQNGELYLEKSNNLIYIDSLYKKYNNLFIEYKKTKKTINKKLQKLHVNLAKKYFKEKNLLLVDLNEIYYLDLLQKTDPLNIKIDNYLKENKNKIICDPFLSIVFHYTNNNIDNFLFEKLNINNYPKSYIKIISIGIFNFLRYKTNKGDKQYQKAINWLKTTDLYKQDSIYIKKEITPLNNLVFKNKLKTLSLIDTSFNKTTFSEILKKNPSKYYLIDFWATWCAPCIKGIQLMEEMKFPKNVKVISLSLDKINIKEKWQTKTKELNQKISFLVDEKNQKNKEFLKFIELQSVPRYILIDKNMNLIDEAFLHPNELQFLPKLKDVKNHKYW